MLSMCTGCNIQCSSWATPPRNAAADRYQASLATACWPLMSALTFLRHTPINLCIGFVLAAIAFLHKLSEAQRLCSALRSAHTTAFARCGMSQRNPGCGTAASLLIISNTVSCLCERAFR